MRPLYPRRYHPRRIRPGLVRHSNPVAAAAEDSTSAGLEAEENRSILAAEEDHSPGADIPGCSLVEGSRPGCSSLAMRLVGGMDRRRGSEAGRTEEAGPVVQSRSVVYGAVRGDEKSGSTYRFIVRHV